MIKNSKIPIWIQAILSALLWIGLWWILSLIVDQEVLIPSPRQAMLALWQMIGLPEFWLAAALSMVRILIGFLLAVAVGALGGILSHRLGFFRWLFSTPLHLVRSVPVASFIILAYVWVATDRLPIFISFLMVLPLVWGNVQAGMANTDIKELEMGKVLGLSRGQIWKKIRLPALAPYLRTACVTGLGFAWKSGIAAEVICRPESSLGNLLQIAKLQIESSAVFALTIVIAILSLGLELLLNFLWKEKHYD